MPNTSPGNVLVINASGSETRVALVENGSITEYYLDRKRDRGIVGNIYKGRVVRVLPGMQAAFVDVGLEKAAFLYVSDVFYDPDFSEQEFDLTEGEHGEQEEPPAPENLEAAEAEAVAARAEEAKQAEAPPPAESAERASSFDTLAQPVLSPVEGQATQDERIQPLALSSPQSGRIEGPADGAAVPAEPAGTVEAAAAEAAAATAEDEDDDEEEEEEEEAAAAGEAANPLAAAPAPAEGSGDAAVSGALAAPRPPQAAREVPVVGPGGQSQRRRRRRRRGKGRPGEGRGQEARPAEGRGVPQGNRPHADLGGNGAGKEAPQRKGTAQTGAQAQIQDLLKEGQEIIVQVVKDPIGTKGARITSHISLPGRHLVFMPTVDHIGISRRIENEKERRRLRDIVNRMRPPGTGFIVRTVAENVSEEKLVADIRFLINVWNEVGKEKDKKPAPALLHPDLDMVLRATRDLFTHEVGKLVIDDRDEYERVLAFIGAQEAGLKDNVELYVGEEPIFEAYGIEQEIKRALNRKVWLKSGGYIIIDQAEALVAIDVNSGRYVGKKNLEETITRINVEAAKEIVYQLRLRNIGGIIIIDFIDMDKPQNRDKVFKAMQEALGRDRAKTNVLKISELGLIEMTRKRVRESLGRTLNEPCSYCDGKGFIRSKVTVAYDIFRALRNDAPNFREPLLVINCHPEVAKLIQTEEREQLRQLMDRINKSIQVKPQPAYHQEQFDIQGRQVQAQKGGDKGGATASGAAT